MAPSQEPRVYYRYTQNNSNGCFVGAQYVIVDAATAERAEVLALGAGVYFDGVEAGRDCPCCGDRWTRYVDEYATEAEALASIDASRRREGDSDVYVVVRDEGARQG